MQTIFEKSQKGHRAYSLPKSDPAFATFLPPPALLRKQPIDLPEVSELDLTRHFSQLAQRNMCIDTHFYPLGSCTMKLNPKINDQCAALPGFTRTHPLASEELVQGNLFLIHALTQKLCEICGMADGTVVPNAGAQGEFVGVQMIAAYHRERGDSQRTEFLIPDNAHGTNPATARLGGFTSVPLRTNAIGDLDLEELRAKVSEKTAGLMLTNPNTLGLFSPFITQIAQIVHEAGGLLYYDGANLNPLLNITRVGEMGFDVMHINLHKTFSTPHGGGGPGSAPVLCNEKLVEFLPVPRVKKEHNVYRQIHDAPKSIGRIASFYGNFGIYLRAYVYILLHGHYGLRRVAEQAVINANYLKARLAPLLTEPFPQPCMHEFVLRADRYLEQGVRALDIAKRLLDEGVHAPTVYFPLIIKECMLIEPTETESKATLDHFVACFAKICAEIEENPDQVKTAPHTLCVTRLDEVKAAKDLRIKDDKG